MAIFSDIVVGRILERIGALVKREAIRRCPVDNGQLRISIDYTVNPENDSVTIFSPIEYAPFVEYGTGVFHEDEEGNPDPHSGWDIVPVNAKALKFEIGGETIFAKKVHQEGTHPHPFLRPAVFENYPRIKEIIKEELSR